MKAFVLIACIAGAVVGGWYAYRTSLVPRKKATNAPAQADDPYAKLADPAYVARQNKLSERAQTRPPDPAPPTVVDAPPAGNGAIAGSLLIDPSIDPRQIVLVIDDETPLETKDGDDPPPLHREVACGADGSFSIRGLRQSRYSLLIRMRGDPEPLAYVTTIGVRDGATSSDSRLQHLDLRSKLKTVTLTVTDVAGSSIEGARAGVLGVAPAFRESVVAAGGMIRLLLHHVPSDVEVTAPGYAATVLHAVSADQRVILRRAIPVRISVNTDALPPSPIALFVSLESTSRDTHEDDEARRAIGMSGADGGAELDASATARVSVPRSGRYRVLVTARRKASQFTSAVALPVTGAEIDVTDSALDQRFAVSIAKDALAAALERLK